MSYWPSILVVGIVALAGWFGTTLMVVFLLPEAVSTILLTLAAVTTLGIGTGWQVLRKVEDPPVKGMSERFADRTRRRYRIRKMSLFVKWCCTFVLGTVSAILAGIAKIKEVQSDKVLFLRLTQCSGTMMAVVVIATVLLIWDYVVLAQAANETPLELERLKKRTETLARLEASAQPAEPTAPASVNPTNP